MGKEELTYEELVLPTISWIELRKNIVLHVEPWVLYYFSAIQFRWININLNQVFFSFPALSYFFPAINKNMPRVFPLPEFLRKQHSLFLQMYFLPAHAEKSGYKNTFLFPFRALSIHYKQSFIRRVQIKLSTWGILWLGWYDVTCFWMAPHLCLCKWKISIFCVK